MYGVASETSLAWAIANDLADHGALVTLAYQKRFKSRVLQLLKGAPWVEHHEECDVSDEGSVASFHDGIDGPYHGIVHAVAFAPAEALAKPITETTEEDFTAAVTISAYSLVRVVRHGLPKLAAGSGIVTLTYLGSERVVPGYRVMGTAKAALESLVRELSASLGPAYRHRVNAVSAGPVKTLAASGIPGFDLILDWMAASTPLRMNVSKEDVAHAARFLLSAEAHGITGQVLHVDAGYASIGVPPELERVLTEPRINPYEGPL